MSDANAPRGPHGVPEHSETVIVGAGQAGLTTGYHLAQRGRVGRPVGGRHARIVDLPMEYDQRAGEGLEQPQRGHAEAQPAMDRSEPLLEAA